jgi:hypothetical protein
MKIWHREAKAAQEELAKWDRRIEIANTVAKVVVVVGLSFVPFVGPGGAFLVATAWNAADKGFRMAYNGLSAREALRQFAIELVFDAAFAGLSAFKAVRVVAQPGAAAAKEGVKQEAKTVFIRSLFNTPAKFEGQGLKHLLAGRMDIFRGAEGKLTKAAFEGMERLFQNPKVLGNMLTAEIRGSFLNGSRILAYTPLPFMPNRTPPAPPPAQPTPIQPPRNEGPGAAGAAVKPVVVPPDQPLQAATPVPSEKDRQQVAALVQNLKTSLENLVPSIRDSVNEGLKTVEKMLEDKGVSLEAIKSALDSVQQQAATRPPPPVSEPPVEKTDLERWLASGNLYEGVFNFLNSYNPWTDLLAGLGRAQASVAPYFPPPYFPPPVKPPESRSPDRPSRSDSPDNGASYGPRLAVDNGDGNSYTRYRGEQENIARMFKHDPLATMQGLPNQAAHMAAEALDARAKTQLLLAAEAAKLALQQTQQLAQASAAASSLQSSQGQQQAEAQQRSVALEQAHKALQGLAHTEQSTLTQTHQAPRLIQTLTTPENVSIAADTFTSQANTPLRSRAASRSEERELTALAALQSGAVHTQLQRPAIRLKSGEAAQPSNMRNSRANAALLQGNDAETSPALLALTSVSEAPRLKSSKEHLPLTERSVAANESPSIDVAQVAPLAEPPRASQERTQIHADSPAQGSLLSDALSLQERQTPSYWNTPSAAAAAEDANDNDDTSAGGSQTKAATKARKDKMRRDAQLRQGIIQQLLTQGFEASKREKLLAVLIKLGISEKEYRELVIRVGESEAQQMAQRSEQEQLFKDAEKIALTTSGEMVAASEMATHTTKSEAVEQQPAQAQPKPSTRSRADLYRSLQRGKTTDEVL